jgi:hypothetical protein
VEQGAHVGVRLGSIVSAALLVGALGGGTAVPATAADPAGPWSPGQRTFIPDAQSALPPAHGPYSRQTLAEVGTAAGEVWQSLVSGSTTTDLMHWQSGTWQSVPFPTDGRSQFAIIALGADAGGDVMASAIAWNLGPEDPETGDRQHVDIENLLGRWNGSGFELLQNPPEAVGRLVVLGPDDVLAQPNGGSDIQRLDAGGWHTLTPPAGIAVASFAATADGDVWVSGTSGDPSVTAVAHWDGEAWTQLPTPPGDARRGSQPIDIASLGNGTIALSDAYLSPGPGADAPVRVWNGSWTTLPALPGGAAAVWLAGSSAADIWAQGQSLEHWNGRAWQEQGAGSPLLGIAWGAGRTFLPGSVRLNRYNRLATQPSFLAPIDPAGSTADLALGRGDTVWWRSDEPVTLTDGSATMTVRVAAAGVSATRFTTAGSFTFETPAGNDQMTVSPDLGPTTINLTGHSTLRWARAASTRRLADVQVQRPGSSRFVAWRSETHAAAARFTADAGSGTYVFRVRVHAAGHAAGGWSPSVSLRVRFTHVAQPNWNPLALLPDGFVPTASAPGRHGGTWVAGFGGPGPLLYVSAGGNVTAVRFATQPPGSVFTVTSRGRQVWAAASSGIYERVGDRMQRVSSGSYGHISFAIVAADDVWMASGEQQWLRHWNGRAWRTVVLTEPITEVRADPAGDVWAIGTRRLHHLTQHGWRWVPLPPHEFLSDLLPFSNHDVWVNTGGDIEHWNGRSWRDLHTGIPWPLAGSSGRDLWLSEQGLVQHWDGRQWSEFTMPWQAISLNVTPSGSATAVACGPTAQRSVVLRLDPLRVGDHGFSDPVAWVRAGATVLAHVPASAAGKHGVADATGLQLFDGALHGPGSSFVLAFPAAGSYRIVDPASERSAVVEVPLKRAGADLQVIAGPMPADGVVDVEMQAPGDDGFGPWMSDVTSSTVALPTVPGTYMFRARLRETAGGARSGWSPVLTVTVS